MPVVAKAGAEWNGIESFIGKKVAVNPSYFAFTGAVMDLGYDNPLRPWTGKFIPITMTPWQP